MNDLKNGSCSSSASFFSCRANAGGSNERVSAQRWRWRPKGGHVIKLGKVSYSYTSERTDGGEYEHRE